MERKNKISSTMLKKTFPKNNIIHLGIHSLVVFAFLTYLLCNATASADTPTYSVDAITEGLLAAESQFADLRVDYTTSRRNWREPNQPFRRTEAIYAYKTVPTQEENKRLRYFDLKAFLVDPNAKSTELKEDTLTSFNGEKTIILHRKAESGKPKKGFIFSGYASRYFSNFDRDPHTKIWYFDGRPLGQILKQNRDTFRIVSKSEILDGISTVKLVGTIWHEKVTMTLWVSPERNFLPMKRQFVKTGGARLLMGTVLHDLIQLPNGAWYPKKIQSPAVPLGDPTPAYFLIYEVSKISIAPIPKEFFSPEFTPNTHVIDDILKVSYTTY